MKYIEVMALPGGKKSIEVADDATVGDAISKAGYNLTGYTLSVTNDPNATPDSRVLDGARIVLTRQVKGA